MTIELQVWHPAPAHFTLSPAEVHVWRASLPAKPSRLADLHAILAADERQRAARFHADRDRDSYIVARGVLRTLLGHYVQRPPQELRFSYNLYGKPALQGPPDRTPLCFNLSHSHNLVLYAVTYGRDLGIDIEYVRPNFARDQIAEQFFSPRENVELRALTHVQHTIGFFNCWTRKEAYIKARGQGLSLPLDQFDVSLTPGEPAALLQTRDLPDEAARWSLWELHPGPGYIAALAVEGCPNWQLMSWQWPEYGDA
jgi:4'-phosphopantetheinyl transferase